MLEAFVADADGERKLAEGLNETSVDSANYLKRETERETDRRNGGVNQCVILRY